MQKTLLTSVLFFLVFTAFSQSYQLTGKVTDAVGDPLVGAMVKVVDASGSTGGEAVVGLDGSYRVSNLIHRTYRVGVSYVGFESVHMTLEVTGSISQNFQLVPSALQLEEVSIDGQARGTDAEARLMEKNAQNVLNIISAKQIQLSPDITVANVIQRVSGLSIERNANGDPQYAIVRGMDKRYNNTLVNGIKIPSPDNDNRFIPLDIFPAVFLDRLEVHKSLTADMEADAIGGTVNMAMKDAPLAGRVLNADIQTGYNQMNFNGDFATYSRATLRMKSPSEYFGTDYAAVPADFPAQNMVEKYPSLLPDVIANATYGDRFFERKLGVMLGGSFQNSYRPTSNYSYNPAVYNTEGNPSILRELIERETSAQQQRLAFHAKLSYDWNDRNKIGLYAGQYMLNEFRVRQQVRRESFVVDTDYPAYLFSRFSNIFQTISTADLNGQHQLLPQLIADWHVVYSYAMNDRPDDGVFVRQGNYDASTGMYNDEVPYFQDFKNSRTWERNKDRDVSAYVHFTYLPGLINEHTRFKFGGLYRDKTRDNYYNYYNYAALRSDLGPRGVDWFTFPDIPFEDMANPYGDGNQSSLVYDATERIIAYYLNTDWQFDQTHVQAGLRVEHTEQGYAINPTSARDNATYLTGNQRYTNLFPSFSVKQEVGDLTNIRATYYKGISRPGFFEIVPTIRDAGGGDSFYSERGNPNLRPTIAHSFDVRYEYFPSVLDQILAGVFFKRLIDPIEYGFPQLVDEDQRPQTNRILPQNFDAASNFGAELDITKYFNRFGIRANYTYTISRVTTNKIIRNTDDDVNENGAPSYSIVEQERPLQGQSNHVANVSLLYKDQSRKWDVQLVLNYTGKRIAVISAFFEADQWMKPMTVLDLSVEKGVGRRLTIFAKANNLLNTPYQLIVDKPLAFPEGAYPHQDDPNRVSNIRRDLYGQSYRLGARYRLFN